MLLYKDRRAGGPRGGSPPSAFAPVARACRADRLRLVAKINSY